MLCLQLGGVIFCIFCTTHLQLHPKSLEKKEAAKLSAGSYLPALSENFICSAGSLVDEKMPAGLSGQTLEFLLIHLSTHLRLAFSLSLSLSLSPLSFFLSRPLKYCLCTFILPWVLLYGERVSHGQVSKDCLSFLEEVLPQKHMKMNDVVNGSSGTEPRVLECTENLGEGEESCRLLSFLAYSVRLHQLCPCRLHIGYY